MNRKQRRDYAKNINTPKKLEKIVFGIVKDREEKIIEDYNNRKTDYLYAIFYIVAYVLGNEGFGKTRLPKIMNRILMNIDCFRTGELAPEDFDEIKKEVESKGVKYPYGKIR